MTQGLLVPPSTSPPCPQALLLPQSFTMRMPTAHRLTWKAMLCMSLSAALAGSQHPLQLLNAVICACCVLLRAGPWGHALGSTVIVKHACIVRVWKPRFCKHACVC